MFVTTVVGKYDNEKKVFCVICVGCVMGLIQLLHIFFLQENSVVPSVMTDMKIVRSCNSCM